MGSLIAGFVSQCLRLRALAHKLARHGAMQPIGAFKVLLM
jgi:hypothetical protein